MKKMLTIIGTAGLVVTTGNTLVACSWFDKYDKNADAFLQLNSYEIHLAKRTAEKNESETIEVLDWEKKTEQFTKEVEKRLEINSSHNIKVSVGATVSHILGTVAIDVKPKIETINGVKTFLIQIRPYDIKGKSTWMVDLFATIESKSGDFTFEYNNLKPVYFDVIID